MLLFQADKEGERRGCELFVRGEGSRLVGNEVFGYVAEVRQLFGVFDWDYWTYDLLTVKVGTTFWIWIGGLGSRR